VHKWLASIALIVCLGCRVPVHPAQTQLVSSDNSVTITDVRFPSRSIKGTLWYRAILPTVKPGERLPVLYLLHGANSDPLEVQRLSDVVHLAISSRLIVVMPEAGYSYYTNARLRPYSHWEDAISGELVHNVDSNFPALTDREHRGIAGISMGGYGAVKLAFKHPELYAFVGSMSGALDITTRPASFRRWSQTWRIWTIFGIRRCTRQDEDVFTLLGKTNNPQNIQWFVSCGKADPLYAVNARFLRRLQERQVAVNSSMTSTGGHDWQSWNKAMPQLFKTASERLYH